MASDRLTDLARIHMAKKTVNTKQRANADSAPQAYRIRVVRARKRNGGKGIRPLIEADMDSDSALRIASRIVQQAE
jgi:hypothetical protein